MRKIIVLSILQCVALCAYAQAPVNDLYQYNYASISPAFAGADGTKISFTGSLLRTMQPTGVNDDHKTITTGVMNFEAPIKKINSGVGWTTVITNSLKLSNVFNSLSYNYQVSISENDKLIIGARLGLYQVAYDVLLGAKIIANGYRAQGGVRYTNYFMAGAGVLYRHKKLFAGFSADNLANHELKSNDDIVDIGDPLGHFIVGADVGIGKRFELTNSLYVLVMKDYSRYDINSTITFAKLVVAGLSLQYDDTGLYPKANAGVSIKDKAKVMVVLYSEERDIKKKFGGQLLLQFRLD